MIKKEDVGRNSTLGQAVSSPKARLSVLAIKRHKIVLGSGVSPTPLPTISSALSSLCPNTWTLVIGGWLIVGVDGSDRSFRSAVE